MNTPGRRIRNDLTGYRQIQTGRPHLPTVIFSRQELKSSVLLQSDPLSIANSREWRTGTGDHRRAGRALFTVGLALRLTTLARTRSDSVAPGHCSVAWNPVPSRVGVGDNRHKEHHRHPNLIVRYCCMSIPNGIQQMSNSCFFATSRVKQGVKP